MQPGVSIKMKATSDPTITFSRVTLDLTSFSRGSRTSSQKTLETCSPTHLALMYRGGQFIGAGLAGGVFRGAFGVERSIESMMSKQSSRLRSDVLLQIWGRLLLSRTWKRHCWTGAID